MQVRNGVAKVKVQISRARVSAPETCKLGAGTADPSHGPLRVRPHDGIVVGQRPPEGRQRGLASKIAENALASIDARVEEIANRMEKAKEVQTDYEVIKFAIDTTEKALSDLEVR